MKPGNIDLLPWQGEGSRVVCILFKDENDSSFEESWRGLLADLFAEPGIYKNKILFKSA